MSVNYFVLAKGLLGLQTNATDFRWSYGIAPPISSREAYEQCKLLLTYWIDDAICDPNRANSVRYHYFSGEFGANDVFYKRPFFLGSQLCLRAEDLDSHRPKLTVNQTYHKRMRYRFMNLHGPNYILTDITSYALLRYGYATLHCSAFRYANYTVVVFAPPNTGKTLTTVVACMDYDADFIAEDLAITDGKTVFAVPWTSTFRYYDRLDNSVKLRAIRSLTQKIPLVELLNLANPRPITDYLGGGQKLLDSSKVTHLVILEQGSGESLRATKPESAIEKVLNLSRYEFNYLRSPLITAYEYMNPSLEVRSAWDREQSILEALIGNVDEVMIASAPQAASFAPMIMDALAK